MNKITVCTLVVFLLLTNISLAESVKEVQVDVLITPSHNSYSDLVVGDSFTYKMGLINPNEEIINTSVYVQLFDPDNNPISRGGSEYREGFDLFLTTNQSQQIIPYFFKERDDNSSKIFDMKKEGNYYLRITSETPITFIDSKTKNFFPNQYDFNFGVMPQWEKRLADRSNRLNEDMLSLTKETRDLSKRMEIFTILMAIIALISLIKEEVRNKIFLTVLKYTFYAVLAILIAFIILAFIGWIFF